MTIDDFVGLKPHDAQAALSGMAYSARQEFVDAYRESHGIELTHHAAVQTEEPASLIVGGWFLVLAGVAISLGAFFFNVGIESTAGGLYNAPERIANIDRIAIRHMILATGLACFVAGWVVIAAGYVSRSLRKRL
nr:hypothetical protein [Brevundimonas diminuta]